MKYRLTFRITDKVSLPVQYNKILQASLLNWLGENEYGCFLHDQGYEGNGRNYKLFTFSNIQGRYVYDKKRRRIDFFDEISLYISFYSDESHEIILDNIQRKKPMNLGWEQVELIGVDLVIEEINECIVETVSPITIHSTFETKEGKRKTYYYAPKEKDFSDMIRQNLIRKYKVFYNKEPEDDTFSIKVIKNNYCSAKIIYDRFVICGWKGRFLIKGSEEMIKLALLSGIGARNSIGMGCVVQLKPER